MKINKFISALICLISFFSTNAQPPVFDWVKQMGKSTGEIIIFSSVTDASGNLYMTGVFDGTVNFDPAQPADSLTDAGFGDIFISKIDSAGNLIWVKQIGRESYDQGSSIELDSSGNIYVTGFFSRDSTDFDPDTSVNYLYNPMGSALTFVLKLNPAGNFQWAKELESGNSSPASISLDISNNILLTGIFSGTVDFDPGLDTANLTAAINDIYILKLDNSGIYIWSKQIDVGTTSTRSYSVAADAADNIYITGLLLGTVDFDPGAGISNLTSTSQFGGEYILKLDSSGNFSWAKAINGELSQTGADRSIRVDNAGNLYTAGWFNNTVDFDPNAGVFNLSNTITTGASTYLLKLDSAGNFVWAKQIGDPGDGNFRALTLDASDNLYVSGMFNTTGDFNPGAGTDTLSPSGGNNFVVKYDSAGNYIWAVNFSNISGSSDNSHTLNVDPFGNIITTGVFHDTCDFDPGPGVFNLTSISGIDAFIHKMNQSTGTFVNDISNNEINSLVYPNPNNGTFQFKTNKGGVYYIANEAGQILKSFYSKTGNNDIITINGFPGGVYFIIGNNQSIATGKRIVIQK